MKKPLFFPVILLVLTLAFFSLFVWKRNREQSSRSLQDHQLVQLKMAQQTLKVEVVYQPQSIEKGLGDRTELGSDGMLFLLPESGLPTFWMKGMQFPLDFVWLEDGVVKEIMENIPVGTSKAEKDLPLYTPSVVVNQVLELPAGDAEKRQIKVGDKAEILK
jgi:uncharacterized membrane protein (UPF0127 family)